VPYDLDLAFAFASALALVASVVLALLARTTARFRRPRRPAALVRDGRRA